MRNNDHSNPNKFKERNMARCDRSGCGVPLTTTDIANGHRFCSRNCMWQELSYLPNKLFDDPTKVNADD